MSDNDSEVDRIMTGRPPSSYGSMCSDDPEDDDEIQDADAAPQPIIITNVQTRVKLHRPDSPETTITSITQGRQSSVHNEGVYITAQKTEQEPVEVMRDVEDHESFVLVRDPQIRERRNVQVEESPPEPVEDPMDDLAAATVSQNELDLPFVFRCMLQSLRTLNALELRCFVRTLCSQCKGQLEFRQLEQEGEIDVLGVVDRTLEKWDKGEALHITIRALNSINKREVASLLERVCRRVLMQYELRTDHKRHFYSLYEGVCRPGQQRYIRQVYVEAPLVLKSPTNVETPIRISDLFSPREGEDRVRVVVTTGVPAIGLTVTVNMFLTDWTEEKGHQDFQFVFALPGRDLHLVRNSEQSFLEFLSSFHPEAKRAEFLASPDCSVLFVIDALELCRHPLDFQNNPSVTEVTTQASADALLTSLIKGDLLPHAHVWITARYSSCRKIPANCISRLTELKGFESAQKDEYFTKRTKEPGLGRRVLDHVKASPGLYDACYLPLFSWIVSFVYERHLQDQAYGEAAPALTTFYVQYIIVLTNRKIERYYGTGIDASRWKDEDKDFLMKMGKLALKMLMDGKTVFSESSVSSLGLNMDDVTHRGGLSSETGEPTQVNERSFRFVHPSIQKFMAALYAYVTFRTTGENALESQSARMKIMRSINELYKPAIDRMLAKRDGNLNLFVHFLLGLATRGAELHLRGHLLPQYHPEPKGMDDVLKFARKRIKENSAPEQCRYLEICLKELEEGRNGR